MSISTEGVSKKGEVYGNHETRPPTDVELKVEGFQETYNRAVKEGKLEDLEAKVGISIHPWEHLALVLGAAENAESGSAKYYLARSALELCKEGFPQFFNAVSHAFRESVNKEVNDAKFLFLRIEDYFYNLCGVIQEKLSIDLKKVAESMKVGLSEDMEDNFPLLIANINEVMLQWIEHEHDVVRLAALRENPMMTQDLLSKIFQRMDEEIQGRILEHIKTMQTPELKSANFAKACQNALLIVAQRTPLMGGEWQAQNRASIFDTAIGLSTRNTILTRLHKFQDAPPEKKEVIERKMDKILNRKLKECAVVVVGGEKSKIKNARKSGYKHIDEMLEVMGTDWVANRKKAFMIAFVQKMPSRENVVMMHSLYRKEMKDDVLQAFQERAETLARREVQKIAYQVADENVPEMTVSVANTKTLKALFSKDFTNVLGQDWIDQEYKNFPGYIDEAQTSIREGVRPEYLDPEFDPDLMVYTTKSYQKLLGQVSESEQIDYPSLNYSLKVLAEKPYDPTTHEAWLALCDQYGLAGHRAYFEMAHGLLDRYENVAKYQSMMQTILTGSFKYKDFFDGDHTLQSFVTDRFRIAVKKDSPELKNAIYGDQNWQDQHWHEHRELLAKCYKKQVKPKLIDLAGDDLSKVHEYVWRFDGEPDGDPNYGGNHAFDENLVKFVPAFWAAVKEKLTSHIDSL